MVSVKAVPAEGDRGREREGRCGTRLDGLDLRVRGQAAAGAGGDRRGAGNGVAVVEGHRRHGPARDRDRGHGRPAGGQGEDACRRARAEVDGLRRKGRIAERILLLHGDGAEIGGGRRRAGGTGAVVKASLATGALVTVTEIVGVAATLEFESTASIP